MALNYNVIGAINTVAMLLSIPIIGTGIWLANQAENSCIGVLQWPVILIGVAVLIVGIIGIVGGCFRLGPLLIVYLIGMMIMLVLLGSLVVFVFMVTTRGSGHPVPSRVYLEYRLEDFSGFLRHRVQGPFKWARIKRCLRSTEICGELNQTYHMAQDFFNAPLSPVQSGCCKPPTECGYTFINPTYWISPINTAADIDCLAWNNDQSELCYSCDSCKAGLLASIRKTWRRANVILIVTLIALVCVYLMGCCAFRNAKTDEIFRRYKQGYT